MKTTSEQALDIDVGTLRFSAIAYGDPRDPLALFLHGFLQFADAWRTVLPVVAERGFYAVAIDQRGYSSGARPVGSNHYRIDLLAQDVLGFANALGHMKFHVVGHDWGGMIAWALAANHPERILTNTVLSTPHPLALGQALKSNVDQMKRSSYLALFLAPFHLAEKFLKARNWQALRKIYGDHVAPEIVDRNIKRLSQEHALTAALNWYRSPASQTPVGRVSASSLYIWGDQDQALGKRAAHLTRRYVDGPYGFETLLGASHWLIEDRPREICALIVEHLTTSN